ncbi:hypothetical protein [Alkaliflexus imshenetskii]|uniref:hypothetical protein n=1 Tax=Alkaliflexus imshenetskii TaxID=286730 RepID=UPI0012F7AC6B|nr:hypothetical protein [Alkaliflexus imshenetskii]
MSCKLKYFMLVLMWTMSLVSNATSGDLSLRGYVKTMPSFLIDEGFDEVTFNNLVHNRLNLRWRLSDSFSFTGEARNRLLYNPLFVEFPFYKDYLGGDNGLVNLTGVWLDESRWLGVTNLDRLFVDWRQGDWQVRIGRQRVNWGINMVSNPNDLFNTYSFFDFDYPERPGADAIRFQYFTGDLSRLELVYNPADNSRESVAAALYAFNRSRYDLQLLAGYYRHRLAIGGGWAGSIGEMGFKGEATWFYDVEAQPSTRRGNLVAAAGVDHLFATGTFGLFELLYNGGHRRQGANMVLITTPLAADNIMFSQWAMTASATHPFSPVLSANLAIMALPDAEAIFISPGFARSLTQDWDFEFVGQLFTGSGDSPFAGAGSAWFVSLKYSF